MLVKGSKLLMNLMNLQSCFRRTFLFKPPTKAKTLTLKPNFSKSFFKQNGSNKVSIYWLVSGLTGHFCLLDVAILSNKYSVIHRFAD